MQEQRISAKKRGLEVTPSSRRMRRDGILPGVIYGTKSESMAIELESHVIEQVLNHHLSETILVEVDLEGEGNVSVLLLSLIHI